MLKLSVRPGEYLIIGDNVKVIFTGGTGKNLHVMVDAPKEVPVVRSKAAQKAGEAGLHLTILTEVSVIIGC